MSNDKESLWMRTRMDRMREHRNQSIPAFIEVWRAAKHRRKGWDQDHSPRVRGLAFASLAMTFVLAVAVIGYWGSGRRQQNDKRQLEFTAVDGVLVTYWQAPSDALFETVSWTEPAER